MRTILEIEKTACCVLNNPIQSEIGAIPGVFGVIADMFAGKVTVDHTPEVKQDILSEKLLSLGYKVVEDKFTNKSNNWDTPQRMSYAVDFVNEIKSFRPFGSDEIIMDLGCGTGLVGIQILDEAQRVIFVDNSPSMLEVLESKLSYPQLEKSEIFNGTVQEYNGENVNRVVSLTAFHHIEKTDEAIEYIYQNLSEGGLLIIGDIEKEDGSFHAPDTVPHNGFDREDLCSVLESKKFRIEMNKITSVQKKGDKEYNRFIIIASKLTE